MVAKTSILKVNGLDIAMVVINESDYISLTDMVKEKMAVFS